MNTQTALDLFIQSRQYKNLSRRSIRWYKDILDQLAAEYPKLPKRTEQIERFILARDVGDERRHGYYRCLKCFYRFLQKRKLIKNSPIESAEEPKLSKKDPQFLLPEQINRILGQTMKPYLKAAILAYVDTGARLSEIHRLTVEDLIETPYGFVALVTGKTGDRPVPLSYETYHALMVNLPFKCTTSWLYRQIKAVCKRVGVKATPLTFRHTFATLWSGDELVLQQIMGHSSITTTRRYRHLRTRVLQEQHSQYSPLKMVYGNTLPLFPDDMILKNKI